MSAHITVLSKTQLSELEEKLKLFLPHSLKFIGIVKTIQTGRLERELLVNKWPDFTVLLDRSVAGQGPDYLSNVYSVFTCSSTPDNQTDLEDFLLQDVGINWGQKIVIGGCAVSVQPAIAAAASKKGCVLGSDTGSECEMYWINSQEDLPQFALPAGYTLGSLGPEDAPLVSSQWKHTSEGSEVYARFLLERFPSIALRDSATNTVVGYYLQQWFSALGMLYVREEHRGKGLSKTLVVETARQALRNGELAAFCYVERDNDISAGLHLKCGFKKVEGAAINWPTIVPANTCSCSCKAKCCV